ncbi:uncharacterized protein ACA1_215030 [Acanthamoeba castellanii str. Neff]|uniref:Uncharacterized protein n=1 Tax=Acanthamoeba castellanii (strain ATCC 30010 / Neff) TaxID=1257118 RepID=L8GPI8_ACACF|nr:uncharacterized protein ACA1_215030 [Acanthamoeba castellanii str. Neff]ELR15074.1 hypothetical protein ACA1_215030 [Acanthamoeba castellanii str. Neff]
MGQQRSSPCANGRVELRAMIVGGKEVGKHALAHILHHRFKGVSRHICHKGWMHSDDDDDEEGGSRWWDNKADDDWTVVGPCLEFGDALVHVTTEVATLTPTNQSTTDKADITATESGVVDGLQEVQIVRMAECLAVRPDVVVLVFAVTDAASILAVSRQSIALTSLAHNFQIMPAIRREYNHLPVLLAVALCHRIGASNYVDVSVYEVVGLGATLKEIIELEKDLAEETLRFRSPRVPDMLDTIPSIHYRLRCLRCSAMPIVGQAWGCKSCGHTEQGPMCSSCKRDHIQRKVEHRVVPYSAERNNRGVKQKAARQLLDATQEGEGEGEGEGSAGDDGRDRVVGEVDQQLARVGFSHRNSRFFHHHRGHHHKRQRVDHRHQASEKEKGVDEIFQLFSKRN